MASNDGAATSQGEGLASSRPFLPGSVSLIEDLDTRVMVVLRDGRHLIGTLRSLDQFSNLVLEETVERHIVGNKFSDIYLGLYVVRGESLVLLGGMVCLECLCSLAYLFAGALHTNFVISFCLIPMHCDLPRISTRLLLCHFTRTFFEIFLGSRRGDH